MVYSVTEENIKLLFEERGYCQLNYDLDLFRKNKTSHIVFDVSFSDHFVFKLFAIGPGYAPFFIFPKFPDDMTKLSPYFHRVMDESEEVLQLFRVHNFIARLVGIRRTTFRSIIIKKPFYCGVISSCNYFNNLDEEDKTVFNFEFVIKRNYVGNILMSSDKTVFLYGGKIVTLDEVRNLNNKQFLELFHL